MNDNKKIRAPKLAMTKPQAIIAKLDAQWDEPDMHWSVQEIEAHKARGGWPEYA